MKILRNALLIILPLAIALTIMLPARMLALRISQVRMAEPIDTIRVDSILNLLADYDGDGAARAFAAAQMLMGAPYEPNTLEGEDELLTINLHSFDGVTFVETVMALSKASREANPSWRTFADMLENVRYRRGEMDGYPSRLHYNSEWISENIYRGNIKEVTTSLPGHTSMTRSLDYMTRNRDLYPALADSAVFDRQQMIEWGLRAYSIPYMRKETINKKNVVSELHDGDIIMLLTNDKALDAKHVAMIKIERGQVYLLHASPDAGSVVIEQSTLDDWFKHEGRSTPGYRVVRIL